MNLTEKQKQTSIEAVSFVLKNRSKILKELELHKYKKNRNYPITSMFTAGIPGAGKTEYAEYLVSWYKKNKDIDLLHIDIDKYRKLIPSYNGKNSYVVQDAAAKVVDKVFDVAHKRHLNYIMDTTFSSPKTLDSVKRAVGRDRLVVIDFIYLSPEQAWLNTQARAIDEGRYVPKKVFTNAYFESISNVKKIKSEYKNKIELNVIIKEENAKELQITLKKLNLNVNSIEDYLPKMYTEEELNDILHKHDIKETLK